MIGETILTVASQEPEKGRNREELLELLRKEGLTDPYRYKAVIEQQKHDLKSARQRMQKPVNTKVVELIMQGYSAFPSMQEAITEFARLQLHIEGLLKEEVSQWAKKAQQATAFFYEKLNRPYQHMTLDEAIEKRSEVIGEVHEVLKQGEECSVALLDMLTEYKIGKVIQVMTQTSEKYKKVVKEGATIETILGSVEAEKGRTSLQEETVEEELLISRENLRLLDDYAEQAKRVMEYRVSFKDDEKKSIEAHQALASAGVGYCKLIGENMADTVESLDISVATIYTIQKLGKNARMVNSIMDPLTKSALTNVEAGGQALKEMAAIAANASNNGTLPGIMGNLLGGYIDAVLRAEKARDRKIENIARRLLYDPGAV